MEKKRAMASSLFHLLFFIAGVCWWSCAVSSSPGYKLVSIAHHGNSLVATLQAIQPSSSNYGPDIPFLQLRASYDSPDRFHLHITDKAQSRWEIPHTILPRHNAHRSLAHMASNELPHTTRHRSHRSLAHMASNEFQSSYTEYPFGFAITRISSGETLLNSTPSSFASDFDSMASKELPHTTRHRSHRSLTHMASNEFQFSYTEYPFGFAITRTSSGETLFNSTPSSFTSDFDSMVFKDQYLEISTSIPQSASLYGIGESTRPAGFKLSPGSKYTLWAEDVGSENPNINLYGSLPFYMDVRSNGNSHGVLLLNSNGMDVLYESNHLTYRVIGGVLDFYFFSGPSPLSVMEQYTRLVGRPAPMPYWSLGFHQCRYGYKNVTDIETVAATYKIKDIPLDVMWSDIDYMDAFKDFTVDPINYPADRLKAFVDKLHANGQKYVIIIDPGIKYETNYSTYEHGIKKDIFIKGANGENYLGQVWPGPVYFPDFLHPNVDSFWATEISNFHQTIPFDGLWIDMNEISNFCSGISCTLPTNSPCPIPDDQTTCCLVCSDANPTQWDYPPYKINSSDVERPLGNNTIATSATHFGGILEYDAHNLYGFSEAIATNRALRWTLKKRPFILSRSTFIGSGAYTAHWTGDNGASWNDLAYSIVGVMNSGLFGIPMVGADICGFSGDTWEELCNRWIQVGAFYPFSRDHSEKNSRRQELYLWDSVAESARKALGLRYQLLPYLYTLVYQAHKMGAPMARPLFFHFADDPSTFTIDAQFLLGRSILVSPVMAPNTTYVNAYFPAGTWYSLFNHSQVIINSDIGSYQTLAAPMDTINVHVHEGSILPLQEAALTTVAARKTPFKLVIAFSLNPEKKAVVGKAEGTLFLDDGEDIEMGLKAGRSTFVKFSASRGNGIFEVRSVVQEGSFAMDNGWVLQRILVLGTASMPEKLQINGKDALQSVQVKKEGHLSLEISQLDLPIGKPFSLQWITKE